MADEKSPPIVSELTDVIAGKNLNPSRPFFGTPLAAFGNKVSTPTSADQDRPNPGPLQVRLRDLASAEPVLDEVPHTAVANEWIAAKEVLDIGHDRHAPERDAGGVGRVKERLALPDQLPQRDQSEARSSPQVRERLLDVGIAGHCHARESAGVAGLELSLRIKATFRLDVENVTALEEERLRRISADVKRSDADLSDLVNEAIRRTFRGGRLAHA